MDDKSHFAIEYFNIQKQHTLSLDIQNYTETLSMILSYVQYAKIKIVKVLMDVDDNGKASVIACCLIEDKVVKLTQKMLKNMMGVNKVQILKGWGND